MNESELLELAIEYAKDGSLTELKSLLEIHPGVLSSSNSDGWTPIFPACFHGKDDIVSLLIIKGANVRCRDKNGIFPLHMSSYKGHSKICKQLLRAGADINSLDKWDRTPLHWASRHGQIEAVYFLVNSGANIHLRDKWGLNALQWACINDHQDIAALLTSNGAQFQTCDSGVSNEIVIERRLRKDLEDKLAKLEGSLQELLASAELTELSMRELRWENVRLQDSSHMAQTSLRAKEDELSRVLEKLSELQLVAHENSHEAGCVVAELEAELQGTLGDQDLLSHRLRLSEERIAQLEATARDMTDEIDRANSKVEVLEQRNRELTQNDSHTLTMLQAAQASVSELLVQLESTEHELSAAQAELAEKARGLVALENEGVRLTQQLEQVSRQGLADASEVAAIQDAYSSLLSSKVTLETKLSLCESNLRESEKQKLEHLSHVRTLQESNSILKHSSDELAVHLEQAQAELVELGDLRQSSLAKTAADESAIRRLDLEVSRLNQSVVWKDAQLNELGSLVSELKLQASELQNKLTTVELQKADLGSRRIQDLNSETSLLESTCRTLADQLRIANEERAGLIQQNSGLREAQSKLRERYTALEDERQRLAEEVAASTAVRASFESQRGALAEAKKSLLVNESLTKGLYKKIMGLEAEAEKLAAAEDQIRTLRKSLSEAETEKQALAMEMTSLRRVSKQLELEASGAKNRLKQSEPSLLELESALTNLKMTEEKQRVLEEEASVSLSQRQALESELSSLRRKGQLQEAELESVRNRLRETEPKLRELQTALPAAQAYQSVMLSLEAEVVEARQLLSDCQRQKTQLETQASVLRKQVAVADATQRSLKAEIAEVKDDRQRLESELREARSQTEGAVCCLGDLKGKDFESQMREQRVALEESVRSWRAEATEARQEASSALRQLKILEFDLDEARRQLADRDRQLAVNDDSLRPPIGSAESSEVRLNSVISDLRSAVVEKVQLERQLSETRAQLETVRAGIALLKKEAELAQAQAQENVVRQTELNAAQECLLATEERLRVCGEEFCQRVAEKQRLEETNTSLCTELTNVSSELKDAKQSSRVLSDRVSLLQSDVEVRASEVADTRAQLGVLSGVRENNERLVTELAALQSVTVTLRSELEVASLSKQQTIEELRILTEDNADLKQQLQGSISRCAELYTRLSGASDLASELEVLRAELAKREDELRSASRQVRDSAGRLIGMQRKVESTEAELREAQLQVTELSVLLVKASKQEQSLHDIAQALVERHEVALTEQRAVHDTQVTALSTEIDALRAVISKLEQQIRDLDKKLAEQNSEVSKADSELVAALFKLSSSESEGQFLRSEVEDLSRQLSESAAKLSESETRLQETRTALATGQRELASAQTQLHEMMDMFATSNDRIQQLKLELAEARSKLAPADCRITESLCIDSRIETRLLDNGRRVTEAERRVEEANKRNAELERKAADEQAKVVAAELQSQQMSEQLRVAESKLRELQERDTIANDEGKPRRGLAGELYDTKTKLEVSLKDLSAAQQQIHELMELVQDSNDRIQQLRNDVTHSRSQQSDSDGKLLLALRQLDEAGQRESELQSRLDLTKNELVEVQTKLRVAQSRLTQQDVRTQELEKRLSDSCNRSTELQFLLSDAKTQLVESQASTGLLTGRISDLELLLARHEQKLVDSKAKGAEHQSSLVAMEVQLEETRLQLAMACAKLVDSDKRTNEQTAKAAKLSADLTEVGHMMSDLQVKLNLTKDRLSECEIKLQQSEKRRAGTEESLAEVTEISMRAQQELYDVRLQLQQNQTKATATGEVLPLPPLPSVASSDASSGRGKATVSDVKNLDSANRELGLRIELEQTKRALQVAEDRLEQAKERIESDTVLIADLREKLTTVEAELKDTTGDVKTLMKTLVDPATDAKLVKATSHLSEVSEQLKAVQAKQVAEAEAHALTKASLARTEAQWQESSSKMAILVNERMDLQLRLTTVVKQFASLNRQLKLSIAQVAGGSQFVHLHNQLQDTLTAIANLNIGVLSPLSAEDTSGVEADLQIRLLESRRQLSDAAADKADLQTRVLKLENVNTSLENELYRERAEVTRLGDHVVELQGTNRAFSHRMETLGEELDSAIKKLLEVGDKAAALEKDKGLLTELLANSEKKRFAVEWSLSELQDQSADAMARSLEILTGRLDAMQQRLELSDEKLQASKILQRQLSEINGHCDELESERLRLSAQLKAAKASQAEKSARLTEAQRRIAYLEDKCVDPNYENWKVENFVTSE